MIFLNKENDKKTRKMIKKTRKMIKKNKENDFFKTRKMIFLKQGKGFF